MELGGELVKQEEDTEAAERLFEALEALLGSAQEAVRGALEAVVQRLLENNPGLPESDKARLLTSYFTTRGEGETSAAVQRLLTRLNELVSEALSSVRRLRATVPEEGINPEDQEKCESVERLLRHLSELSTRGQEALGEYSLTLVQRGDSTGQGGPAETVQRLLTGVTGVLTAAEQCVLTPGAAGCTSEDSPLCTELAGFVMRAQDAVLTFYGETVDERKLPEAARSLLESFADLLKGAARTVRCYRVKEERGGDPWGWDHTSVPGETLPAETEPPDPERRDQAPVPEYQTSIKSLLGDPERRDQAPVLHPLLSGSDPSGYQTPGTSLHGDPEAPVLKKEERASLSHGRTVCVNRARGGWVTYLALAAVLVLVIAGLLAGIGVLIMERDSNNGEYIKLLPSCGYGWIWYHSKCFYFSEVERNWTEAEGLCGALDSSLAMIDTQEELTFMLRYKGDSHHWIGLRRDSKTQPWMWVNGTKFNNWFTGRGRATKKDGRLIRELRVAGNTGGAAGALRWQENILCTATPAPTTIVPRSEAWRHHEGEPGDQELATWPSPFLSDGEGLAGEAESRKRRAAYGAAVEQIDEPRGRE
ncbi:hypothetical protein NDU88_000607 [Pleurodeles waltl]|uniref:C-type lectin domain-containing protein n=1 Tax=Pleurodeles waltl TaxID=8319 RepID=A0AAV7P681_PLEWA|nr:hypothetical protein NDU88_000607 [Pleurodeles waltl]